MRAHHCIQYYLIGCDIYFQSHLGLCKGRCLLNAFRGGQKELPLGQENGPKAFGLPPGLTGRDSGKGKEAEGSSAVCKDQRFLFFSSSTHFIDTHVLSASDDTLKKSRLKQFFSLHKTPPGQNKTARTAGGRAGPLYWTKGPSIIAGGKEGGQNSNRGTMALWESKLAHIRTPKECMDNQTTEKKPTNNLEPMFSGCQ